MIEAVNPAVMGGAQALIMTEMKPQNSPEFLASDGNWLLSL